MQMVRAGLKAVYLPGRQVAADANTAGAMYPDQSLFPVNAGRTPEGFYQVSNGLECCIARGVAYADYCDLRWRETSKPDPEQAKKSAEGIFRQHPDQMLAYNCSPSFNWKANLDDATIAKFQRELGVMGYKFQFNTLAGFHQLNRGMFEPARNHKVYQVAAYSDLQAAEFDSEENGYTATRHQREAGTGYYDAASITISGGSSSTIAMGDSTEYEQFSNAAE